MQLTSLFVLMAAAMVLASPTPAECNETKQLHASHGHDFWGCGKGDGAKTGTGAKGGAKGSSGAMAAKSAKPGKCSTPLCFACIHEV